MLLNSDGSSRPHVREINYNKALNYLGYLLIIGLYFFSDNHLITLYKVNLKFTTQHKFSSLYLNCTPHSSSMRLTPIFLSYGSTIWSNCLFLKRNFSCFKCTDEFICASSRCGTVAYYSIVVTYSIRPIG